MNVDFVFEIIGRRSKQLLIIVLATAVATCMILLLQRPVYKSEAVYTAANPNMGDRSNIYRNQFWEQYFYYGSEIDNDRLMAISQSEEMLRWLADSFQLRAHYRISDTGNAGAYKTLLQLKENLRFSKNEFGHVKMMIWDEDKNLAAAIGNTIVAQTHLRAISFANNMKQVILNKLKTEYQTQRDSLMMLTGTDELTTARKKSLTDQLLEKEQLIQQFNTSINDVPSLFVIQSALPALKKDKPNIVQGTLIAAVASFLFALLLLLIPGIRSRIS